MPVMLNSILQSEGFELSEVRLLRHQDNSSAKDRTPYKLWCKNRPQFDFYQATQGINHENKLRARFWASFVGTPSDETLFVGIYSVGGHKLLEVDTPTPHRDSVDKAGSCHVYELVLDSRMSDFIGKMIIDWGEGTRSWIQRADNQNKRILELRKQFKEDDFPGFLNFIKPLSEIEKIPNGWINVLKNSRGIYLLTCPRTKEQYVGSATGETGFWGRWLDYAQNGHGGDVALKSRDPSDYQVCILEVAGTALSSEQILELEAMWKRKLQSREMGLNRN
jgi:hypothetical protein